MELYFFLEKVDAFKNNQNPEWFFFLSGKSFRFHGELEQSDSSVQMGSKDSPF